MRVVTLARKPLSEGNVASNVVRHWTGALHIDATRISTSERMSFSSASPYKDAEGQIGRTWNPTSTPGIEREQHSGGRWPANLILSHLAACRQTGTRKIKAITGGMTPGSTGAFGGNAIYGEAKGLERKVEYGDADGMETIATWDCEPGCPVAELDAWSGNIPTQRTRRNQPGHANGVVGWQPGSHNAAYAGEVGGASRFFKQVKP